MKIPNRFLFLLSALMLSTSFMAQIAHEGAPFQWASKTVSQADIPLIVMDNLDMEAIEAEDRVVDQYKETPYRFGIEHEVSIDLFDQGLFTALEKGDKLWQVAIECPRATSINLLFNEWYIPEGGQVTIWNSDRSEYLGAYTHANNKEYNSFAVGLIHSERIVVEYYEQSQVTEDAAIEISTVVHGYRTVLNKWADEEEAQQKGVFGNSGSCNMNVNCPDGSAWQAEKRGVALILNGGNAHCTGSLVNTTAQDGTSYFLTAAHCDANESNWVFYFNHETAGCTGTNGPTSQSISGATQLASGAASDYHLVQLSSNVPASYNPYYNGWDRSNSAVSSAVGIHHPSGDVKKISFDDDPLQKTNYSSNTTTSSGNHWRVETWERNTTTEGGSSGSPLFDQNHRIVGQLHGGGAACGNTASDWYGALGSSWSGLSSYLDPLGTGALTLNGTDGGGSSASCTDGIQNQGETGVDCGGPCAPCACNGTNVTVSITLDNYPEETSWSITSGNTTVASGGTYGSQPDGSTVNIDVCLPNGCYNFNINDAYGDGICCSYGNGSYTVSSSAGTLASGGSFASSETTQICVGSTAPTCNDGIQNQGETGVDCGGPCTACASCNDGIQNQGETGVDCGGPCSACPTCNDGVQNQGETGVDCGGPNCAPCSGGGCTDVNINYTNFDSGWSIWNDGGSDCVRSTSSANAYSGTRSARLRDNTSSSTTRTDLLNLSAYNDITVDFIFRAVSMETNEDFWLQISTNGGSSYTTVASYASGSQFNNNTFYSASVDIAGPFSTNTRLRFRCDASSNSDYVYIDNVNISGCLNSTAAPVDDRPTVQQRSLDQTSTNVELALYPNPTNDVINISFETEQMATMQMQILDMQGRTMMTESSSTKPGVNTFRMDTAGLAEGTYLLYISSVTFTGTKIFMVTR